MNKTLIFLKTLTLSIALGSSIITFVRYGNLYIDNWDDDVGRVIAIINPLILLGVGLYLNYLFHNEVIRHLSKTDSKNIKEIKKGVKESNEGIKENSKDLQIIKKATK